MTGWLSRLPDTPLWLDLGVWVLLVIDLARFDDQTPPWWRLAVLVAFFYFTREITVRLRLGQGITIRLTNREDRA